MKSCPTCNRTFEDTFTFCLMDGSILSAPFDPAKPAEQPPREANPPLTQVFNAPAEPESLPKTRPGSAPANVQPTITSPFQPQPIGQPYQTPAVPGSTAAITTPTLPDLARWLFIVRGIAAILIGLLLLMSRVTQ
jgi:hypothetical protein